MNRDGINKTIFWSLLYIFLYSACTVIVNLYLSNLLLLAVGVSGAVYIILNMFCIQYKRERLFINGLVGAMSVMCIGIWFGKHLSLESTISIGSVVTAMDIMSFTRIGKKTVNAKAMSNKTVAAKLFVYGLEKNDVLIPTCGFGDYLYYAMWISGTHALSSSGIFYAFVAFMVFAGTMLQSITVKVLSKRDGFKGFPGTVFPFLCTVLAYLLLYYQGI